jgi:hypothetical protein
MRDPLGVGAGLVVGHDPIERRHWVQSLAPFSFGHGASPLFFSIRRRLSGLDHKLPGATLAWIEIEHE